MKLKICFTFPDDPLTYQVAGHDESRGEISLKSLDGDCLRHERADLLTILLLNELPTVGTALMRATERTAMIHDLGPEIVDHPCCEKGAPKFSLNHKRYHHEKWEGAENA